MRKGVVNTAAFLLFLSDGVLARSFVQFEIREAMARQKMILLVHESDARFGAFDFRTGRAEAPADLQELLDTHESLPFRRRGYERDGMLTTLIERAGFKELFDGAQRTEKQQEVLAAVPTEVRHFDLEAFHDRPVRTRLMDVLLLSKGEAGFTSCVLIHGMGGTGKTVTAVAVVQETAVRRHFSKIYWLVVGQDATGPKIRLLQSVLYGQLTGKEVESAPGPRSGAVTRALYQLVGSSLSGDRGHIMGHMWCLLRWQLYSQIHSPSRTPCICCADSRARRLVQAE